MRQLVKSISVRERRWMRTGRRPPLLLVVMMMWRWRRRVVMLRKSHLRREAAPEAGAELVREILEQHSTVGGGSWDALVKEIIFAHGRRSHRC